MLFWLALCFLVATVINLITKRPTMNPWLWFAGSYLVFYALGLAVGFIRGNPNLAYTAGYFLPLVIIAVGLGFWRAPKWRKAKSNIPAGQSEPGNPIQKKPSFRL
jgi:hypothetical protein